MEFDVFFSISQTPDAAGTFPDETTMYSNYLEPVSYTHLTLPTKA